MKIGLALGKSKTSSQEKVQKDSMEDLEDDDKADLFVADTSINKDKLLFDKNAFKVTVCQSVVCWYGQGTAVTGMPMPCPGRVNYRPIACTWPFCAHDALCVAFAHMMPYVLILAVMRT
jgi:hypothetical protein